MSAHRSAAVLASAALCIGCVTPLASAEVSLPDIFGSGMVLQADKPLRVWGKASPGERVEVTFRDASGIAKANEDGAWSVELPAPKASAEPASLVVAGSNRISLDDVLVGEVWYCSGQSNMQWRLIESLNGKDEAAKANHPKIRFFQINRAVGTAIKYPIGKWQTSTPETTGELSGVAYYFAVALQAKLNVPVGIIDSSWGGTQVEAWTPIERIAADPELKPCIDRHAIWAAERDRVQAEWDKTMAEYKAKVEEAKAKGERPPRAPSVPDALRPQRITGSIYDGMVKPVLPFSIRGALWYQGESNEARAQQYALLLPVMIKSWRDGWGDDALPFGIIQLPNYRDGKDEPEDSAWSHVRESQRIVAQKDPHAGLIVTIDVGAAHDIHPTNKKPVGERSAQWALADVYHVEATSGGPAYRECKIVGSKAVLTFDNVAKGLQLTSGDALHEFAIAGEDKKFVWANARIVDANTVEVWSDQVPHPVAVRYAWNSNPRKPNLTNDTGIPASPFRTDDFPGPTDGKR